MSWNCCGGIARKIPEFDEQLQQCDLLFFAEIRTKRSLGHVTKIFYPNHACIQNSRTSSKGGGVMMLVKKHWIESGQIRQVRRNSVNAVILEINNRSDNVADFTGRLCVAGIYWPPENSGKAAQLERIQVQQLSLDLAVEYRQVRNPPWEIIFIGDLNARVAMLSESKPYQLGDDIFEYPDLWKEENEDEFVNYNGMFVNDICRRHEWMLWCANGRIAGLSNSFTFWSKRGCSNIDAQIMSDHVLQCSKGSLVITPQSDHVQVFLDVSMTGTYVQVPEWKGVQGRVTTKKLDVEWLEKLLLVEEVELKELMCNENIERAANRMAGCMRRGSTKLEADIAMERWMSALEEEELIKVIEVRCGGDDNAGKKRKEKTEEMTRLKGEFYKSQRKWQHCISRSGTQDEEVNKEEATKAREEMVEWKKKIRKLEQVERRKEKLDRWKEIEAEGMGTKNWWKGLTLKPISEAKGDLGMLKEALLKDMGKDEALQDTDSEVEWEWPEAEPRSKDEVVCYFDMENVELVEKLLNKPKLYQFKKGKAPGPDLWTVEVLQVLRRTHQGSEALRNLLRLCWCHRTLPCFSRGCKIKALIKPFRAGNKSNDWRRISLMSIVRKMVERLACWVMGEEYKSSERQGGFKPKYTTSGRMLIWMSWISQARRKKWDRICFLFADFTAYFDNVRLRRMGKLMRRCESMTNAPHLVALMQELGKQCPTHLEVDGIRSENLALGSRLRQGSTWAPTLSALFMDKSIGEALDKTIANMTKAELPTIQEKILAFLMYADDLTMCSRYTAGLGRMTRTLIQQERKDQTVLSMEKTKLQIHTLTKKGREFKEHNSILDGAIMDDEKAVKFLGVLLDGGEHYEKFLSQYKAVATKMELATWKVMELRTFLNGVPWSALRKVYEARVRGAGCYSLEIWCWHGVNELSRIEGKLLRRCFHASRRPSTAAMLWVTGLVPLETIAAVRRLNFAARILEGDCELEKDALKEIICENDMRGTGWWAR